MIRDYHQIALDYAKSVLQGTIPACKWVLLACQRFLVDLERNDITFDKAKAARACAFVELLPHTKAEWANELIILQPWQIFILQNVFGFLTKSGYRRYRQAFVVCPRKNGKSLFSAAVGIYMLVADGETGAEIYCGATTEKQAWEVFKPARIICQNSPKLLSRFGIKVSKEAIYRDSDGAKFQPLVGKPGDGSMPHCAILDERHEHTDDILRDAMRTGMLSRRQALMWTVTTAGFDLSSPCYTDVITGRQILEGTLESDRWFYIEFTIDEEDDWTTKEAAMKANPNYGISIHEEDLEDERKNAINIASLQNGYKTKYLCVWTQAKNAFHNIQNWNKNRDETLNLEDFKGREIFIGCDFAAKQDFCVTAILVPLSSGNFATFGKFYIPRDAVNQPGRGYLQAWDNTQKITVFEGNMVDFDEIEQDIDSLMNTFDVQKIVFDARLASMMEQHLMGKMYPVEAFVQSAINYTEPMRWIDGMINEGKLKHNAAPDDPATWMFANVISKPNKRDMEFPDKERYDNKIDYPVALYMAAAGYLETPVQGIVSLFQS